MMRKNRILAALLAMSVVLSSVYSVFADNEGIKEEVLIEDVIETAAEASVSEQEPRIQEPVKKKEPVSSEVISLLSSLGIMEAADMTVNDLVTRGFVADIIMKMTGLDNTLEPSGTVYIDVDADTQYAYSIEQVSNMGYFRGDGKGNFMPDDSITDKQMASLLLKFAGYSDKASLNSVYSTLGKNVNSSDDLTYYDLANMIYNFLNMGTVNIQGITNNSFSYNVDDDKTVLNDWFSVYTAKGVVESNGITALTSPSTIRSNEVAITTSAGSVVLKVGETKIADEIGKYVEAYYKIDDFTDEPICIGYDISLGRNNITEISLNDLDIGESTSSKLCYFSGDKVKKLDYINNVAIIYNGYYYSDWGTFLTVLSSLANMEGYIYAIDNDGDRTIDVFNISAYSAHEVKSVILSTNTINFVDGGSIVLDDNNFEEFDVVYDDGIHAYLEDLTDDMIVSVALTCSSARTRIAKVIVSTKEASGIVTGVSTNDSGHTVVTLGTGESYRIFDSNFTGIGKNIIFFVTPFGNAIGIVYSLGDEFEFGLLAKAKFDRKDDILHVRIFTSSNTFVDVKVTEKLIIDGNSYKNPYEMYDYLAGVNAPNKYSIGIEDFAKLHCYPIRYRFRQNGTLAEIDTPRTNSSENDNSLKWMGSILDLGTKSGFMNNYVLGFETPVTSDTCFFVVSKAEDDWTDESFNDTVYARARTAKEITSSYNNRSVDYIAYKCNDEGLNAELVIIVSGLGRAGNNSSLFMYDRSVTAYDENREETITKIIGFDNGVETELTVMPEYADSSNVTGLKQGDVVTYGTDNLGRVSHIYNIAKHTAAPNVLSLQTVRDANEGDNFSKIRSGTQRKLSACMIFGYVVKRQGDLILLKNITISESATINKAAATISNSPPAADEVWIRIPASVPVVVYDPTKVKPVYAGTYDEILDGTNKSVIGIRYGSNTTIQEIAVLNESFE